MAGRHPFSKLRDQLSPAAKRRVARKAAKLREEMDLAEMRQARRLSQAALGRNLRVGQAAVAKLEKRTDMYLSTLRRVLKAMGGELQIVAKFPGREVTITNFRDLKDDAA